MVKFDRLRTSASVKPLQTSENRSVRAFRQPQAKKQEQINKPNQQTHHTPCTPSAFISYNSPKPQTNVQTLNRSNNRSFFRSFFTSASIPLFIRRGECNENAIFVTCSILRITVRSSAVIVGYFLDCVQTVLLLCSLCCSVFRPLKPSKLLFRHLNSLLVFFLTIDFDYKT